MKTLFGCLMCLVLTLSQAFAISGGPFSGRTHVAVTGTYAGILVPVIDPKVGVADNSLTVFTLRVPQTGAAIGVAAVFRNGFFYPGTITASGDPASSQISGGLQGQFDDVIESGIINVTIHYYVSGTFQGWKVVARSGGIGLDSVRLKGNANLTYIPGVCSGCTPDPRGDSGGPIAYKVKGFKQSFGTT